jgi:serine-type D-Ala-D-Ala carboxypeptidase (penicillin-binding protein 5/6)
MQLVCVVLNCGPMWNESSALLESGFKNYSIEKVVDKNNFIKVMEVKNGKEKFVAVKPTEDFSIPLGAGEKENVKLSAKSQKAAQAPLRKGDEAGRLDIYLDNKLLKTIKLEYAESVESSSPFFYMRKILRDYFLEEN